MIQLTRLLFQLNVQRRAQACIEIFKCVQNGFKTLIHTFNIRIKKANTRLCTSLHAFGEKVGESTVCIFSINFLGWKIRNYK